MLFKKTKKKKKKYVGGGACQIAAKSYRFAPTHADAKLVAQQPAT